MSRPSSEMQTAEGTASLFARMCDDAAVFPPGNLPLPAAVPAHIRHARSAHASLVGPLVLAAADLDRLAEIVRALPERPQAGDLDLAVTVSLPDLGSAVRSAGRISGARLSVLEVALTESTVAAEVVPELDAVLGPAPTTTVFVEIPRDQRRDSVLFALAGTGHLAKFRTGGVRADLYPDEVELAASIWAAVEAGVPFKATAGLHHAVRNTDPATGFEQHGYLNLLAATGVAMEGANEAALVRILAERDPVRLSGRVTSLSSDVRRAFRSFGTCSIAEPVEELAALGLLDPELIKDLS